MKIFLFKYKYHLFLIVIGLVWIHFFDWVMQISAQEIIYPDSKSYMMAAKELYLFGRPHGNRPLVMAAINGIPYLFGFGDETIYAFSYYVNVFCWLGFLVVLFEILKEFVTVRLAFIFSVISMFFIGYTAYVFHLLTENIYMFLIISGFYFLQKYLKTKAFLFLSVFLAIFVLSMLVKPGSKFLAVFCVLYFIREIVRNYKAKSALLLYGSLLLVVVQCAMINKHFGNFTISYIDTAAWYNYIGKRAINLKEGNPIDTPRLDLFAIDKKTGKKIASQDLKNQLSDNKTNILKAYFMDVEQNATTGNLCVKFCENIKKTTYFESAKNFILILSVWQNMIFSTIGFLFAVFYVFSFRRANLPFFVAIFIGYIFFTSGVSYDQGDVFHAVTFPFALILIAVTIKNRLEKTKPYAERLQK